MLRVILSLFITLFIASGPAFSQVQYDILNVPLCWTVNGQDSSIFKMVYVTSTGLVGDLGTFDVSLNSVTGATDSVVTGFCSTGSSGITVDSFLAKYDQHVYNYSDSIRQIIISDQQQLNIKTKDYFNVNNLDSAIWSFMPRGVLALDYPLFQVFQDSVSATEVFFFSSTGLMEWAIDSDNDNDGGLGKGGNGFTWSRNGNNSQNTPLMQLFEDGFLVLNTYPDSLWYGNKAWNLAMDAEGKVILDTTNTDGEAITLNSSVEIDTGLFTLLVQSNDSIKKYPYQFVNSITDIPDTAFLNSIFLGPSGERWKVRSSSISGFNSDNIFGRTVTGGSKYAYQVDRLVLPDGYVTLGSGQDSTTRATNTVAMLAAFNASVSLDLPLELPNDVVECGYAGTLHLFTINPNATNGNRYLQVVGKGEKSRISVPSLSTSSTTMNIFNLGTDIEYDFKGFKILGPTDNWSPLRTGTYSISSGSSTLTRVSGQNFASITENSVTDDHIGRYITVAGAGPGGSNLRAYIVSVTDNDNVVLNTTASTTVAGADGSWYGAWSQVLSQNMVINHSGNTFEQMGSGKSMTFYPGGKKVTASGFTWPTDIEGAFLYVYDGSSKTIKLRITRRVSSTEVLINTEFNEEIAFEETYVANTSDTYYQTQSRCYMDNIEIIGYFRGGLSFGDGAQDIKINNTYISIFGTAIGTEPDFTTIPMFDCRFTAHNLSIDGAGLHYNGNGNVHPNDGNERVTYFGNGTGINWDGGYIDGNYRTGISIFGGGSNTVDYDRYRPVNIKNVEFGSRLKRSIQTGAYQQHFLSNMVLKGAFHYRGIHASLDKVDVDINLNDPTVSNIYTAETNRPIRLEPTDAGYYLSWTNSNLKINGANQGFIVMDDLNSDSTEDEDRNVNFSNVNIYYNWRSTPTVDISEEIIQLGDGATYNFDGVNVYARTTNNYTNGYILFREARNIYWSNSNIYIRNNSNTVSRYFRIDDEVSDKILNNAIFENMTLKAWTGSSFAEVGNFGEVYRMTNATNFTLNNVNRSFLSLNGTSSITKKEINGSPVYFDNENTISANGYGSGNVEHNDISSIESQYVGVFTTDEKLSEKAMGEINEANTIFTTRVDSFSIAPSNGDFIPISLLSSNVEITLSDANLDRNGIFYIHLMDADGSNNLQFASTGSISSFRYLDNTTTSTFTIAGGTGGDGLYTCIYDAANNILFIGK